MRWTQVLALGAAASIAATAACGSPSKDTGSTRAESTRTPAAPAASAGLMPDAKGPAPEEARREEGRHADRVVLDRPVGHGPEPTVLPGQRRHPEAHVPRADLLRPPRRQERPGARPGHGPRQGLGRQADWTYTLRPASSTRTAARSRSRTSPTRSSARSPRRSCPAAPPTRTTSSRTATRTRARTSPVTTFAGVSTPDDKTVMIHLRKQVRDLPYFITFPKFSPIPKAKDTKQNYRTTRSPPGRTCSSPSRQGTKLSW